MKPFRTLAAFLLLGLGIAAPAHAALIVQAGSFPQPGDSSVIFDVCSGANQANGLTVQGCLDTSPSTLVNFISDEELLVNTGQVGVEATGSAFSYFTLQLADLTKTFFLLILNIHTDQDGFVTFFSTPGGISAPFALNVGSDNFFTITGEDFQSLSFMAADTQLGDQDLVDGVRQVRIGVTVPEPASLAIFGAALLGLAAARRFARRR
ncbi:PEP-CTERM sorting domain-containing protein [Humitalea rosea]|nr:PEP-CTERM sorting domain-containing protein [Humitalea rosea]